MSQSPRIDASLANTLSVSNTKLAASLVALGFQCDCKPLMDVTTEKTVREFIFRGSSIRPEFSTLTLRIAKEWQDKTLDLMHPLSVMMRAQHNYDRLLDMQQQQHAVMNLRAVAGGCMTEYRRSTQPDPLSNFHPTRVPCDDFALVAALAGVGIPVLDAFQVWPFRGEYLLRAILIPFLILSMAAIGVNIFPSTPVRVNMGR